MFVIINLQTWVLLLDFIGIGIPTPPSSRPESPDPEEWAESRDQPHGAGGNGSSPNAKEQKVTFNTSGASSKRPNADVLLSDAKDVLSHAQRGLHVHASVCHAPHPGGRGLASKRNQEDVLENRAFSDLSGMRGSLFMASSSSGRISQDQGSSVWGVEGKISLQVKLNVNSLTVTFNKPEHPLARGSVGAVTAEVTLMRGNVQVSGSLGQGSVVDMTETGAYYRERQGLIRVS